jgi:glutathione synthase/RimK-type ligase-like ATP-grasp enzyme
MGTETQDLRDVSGVFVRFNPRPGLPSRLSLDTTGETVLTHERREGLHHLLAAVQCPVVNRPSGGRSNASKPLQMMELRQAGFVVPAWVATNRLDVVETFARGCANGVIYKAASGLRSRVRRLDDDLVQRLSAGTSASVVQAFIPGRDVRVHTVADRAFATEMVSDAVDYRFESSTQYRATSIDPRIARLCCATGRAAGLTLAGFDFRVTADGESYCLEMNPVPSFLPYEMCSGQPIGEAVLDVLMRVH